MLHWPGASQQGPTVASGAQFQAGADQAGAVVEVTQAHALLLVESLGQGPAVVGHDEPEDAVFLVESDGDAGRFGMREGIADGLLGDPEKMVTRRRRGR